MMYRGTNWAMSLYAVQIRPALVRAACSKLSCAQSMPKRLLSGKAAPVAERILDPRRLFPETGAATFAVTNPATGATLVNNVPNCGPTDAGRAVERASAAFTSWRHQPAKARALALMALHHQIALHAEDLATLITLENGKPLAEARAEVAYGNSYLAWFAEEAKRIAGDVLPGVSWLYWFLGRMVGL